MNNITPLEAFEFLKKGEATSIDVRTKEEYTSGHVPRALNFDFHSENFEEQLGNLPRDKRYVVNCNFGVRAGKAVFFMGMIGFAKAMNLEGGLTAWKKEGLPVEK